MTSKAKWGVIAAIILLIVGMIAYPYLKNMYLASNDAANVPPPSTPALNRQILNINAEVVKYQSITDKMVSIGTLLPDEEVDLSFESSGKIVAIYFTEGVQVKEGELLAKINDKPLQAQLKKLEAQIPLAKDRVYRQRALLEKDAVSQEAFEQVATELETLMADIELVKANILQTELRAPFDGIVGLRSVSEGAYATPSTVITKLTKISPLKIEFAVNESYSSDVREGTPIIFRIESGDGMMNEYHAKVYALESKMELSTRTLNARALYPNVKQDLIPGRYASVEITKRAIEDAIAIPSEAIIPEMGRNMVFIYKNGLAEPTEVTLGIRSESRVQVLDGINVGDTLITSGVMQLRTGMKVSIDNLY